MTRVKSLAAKRHRKIKALARGYKHARRRRVKSAKEALLHAGQYSYIGRRLRKRDLRKLWIRRISAATQEQQISYSKFIKKMKDEKIDLDRKILADIAVNDPSTFEKIVSEVK